MLTRNLRLTKAEDFIKVYRRGTKISGPGLRLHFLKTNQNTTRFGFVVSKKSSAKIVERNRLKRTLREMTRARLSEALPGHDVVVVANPAARTATKAQLESELAQLLKKARLIK